MPVIEWSRSVRHTVQEVTGLKLQGLEFFHPWRPHISASITDQKLTNSFLSSRICPFIIDPYFLCRIHVVPDKHSPRAPDQSSTNLNGRQPVDIDMSGDFIGEINGQIRDIL